MFLRTVFWEVFFLRSWNIKKTNFPPTSFTGEDFLLHKIHYTNFSFFHEILNMIFTFLRNLNYPCIWSSCFFNYLLLLNLFLFKIFHCVKSVQMRSFFWSVFWSVQIQENTDQEKLRIWTVLTSRSLLFIYFVQENIPLLLKQVKWLILNDSQLTFFPISSSHLNQNLISVKNMRSEKFSGEIKTRFLSWRNIISLKQTFFPV